MPTTLADIAHKSNVSQALVGRILNNDPLVRVGPDKRHRVLAVAEELGYAPHAAARMLRSGKSYTIAMTYLNPQIALVQNFFGRSAGALAEVIGNSEYKLVIKSHSDPDAILKWLRDLVRSRSCDAVVLWGTQEEIEREGCLLESLGQPFIARGFHEKLHPNWFQADFDFRTMMRQAVDKLADMGHVRIAFASQANDRDYSREYRAGFHAAVFDRFGRAIPPLWDLKSEERDPTTRMIEGQVAHWAGLPQSERPTALVSGHAGGILRHVEDILADHNIWIGDQPGQFGVAGWADRSILLGQAWLFPTTAYEALMGEVSRELLLPLASRSELKNHVLRYAPSLESVPSRLDSRTIYLAALQRKQQPSRSSEV